MADDIAAHQRIVHKDGIVGLRSIEQPLSLLELLDQISAMILVASVQAPGMVILMPWIVNLLTVLMPVPLTYVLMIPEADSIVAEGAVG